MLGDVGSSPSKEVERGAGEAQGLPWGWVLGEGASWRVGGVLPAWDFICTLGKEVGEPQEPALCPPSPRWGEGWQGTAPSFSPAPQGSQVRPGAVSYPHARHISPPAQARVLPWPWHRTSLAMAMGPRGVRGEKVVLGP